MDVFLPAKTVFALVNRWYIENSTNPLRDSHAAGLCCLELRASQREPLSYGMPSAFGARDFLEVKARTISEIMYGSML